MNTQKKVVVQNLIFNLIICVTIIMFAIWYTPYHQEELKKKRIIVASKEKVWFDNCKKEHSDVECEWYWDERNEWFFD